MGLFRKEKLFHKEVETSDSSWKKATVVSQQCVLINRISGTPTKQRLGEGPVINKSIIICSDKG